MRFLICLCCLLLAGCSHLQQTAKPDDPYYAPAKPVEAERQVYADNGSLYHASTQMALFESIRARRVGDMVTVVLSERTDASKKATTNNRKNNDTNVSDPTVMGSKTSFGAPGFLPLATRTNNLAFDLEAERLFVGEGESKQNNNLQGNITVTVTKVYGNGNLQIKGEKWITINQGDEFIRLTGIIRPADINPDNTILSQKIANARIVYSGRGTINESNSMGWLARFFNSPIWPY